MLRVQTSIADLMRAYQPAASQSPQATGYDSQRLAEGRYGVSFAGNSRTFAEIAMYRGAPPAGERAFDASDVLTSLGHTIERPE